MKKQARQCFKCGGVHGSDTVDRYGYVICTTCESNLGLFRDETIKRHVISFEKAREKDPDHRTYEEEVRYKLDFLEKDYISKKIKLLHIQERLEAIH